MTSTGGTFSGTVAGNVINNVKFSMPATNLKSTKGKMLDNKAYKALKTDKAPNITFTVATLNIGKSSLKGSLSVAGVTKNVVVSVNVVKNGASYRITGSSNLKMSDFGMQTP
jgi:polyisoprenoid-binding protein YceI